MRVKQQGTIAAQDVHCNRSTRFAAQQKGATEAAPSGTSRLLSSEFHCRVLVSAEAQQRSDVSRAFELFIFLDV